MSEFLKVVWQWILLKVYSIFCSSSVNAKVKELLQEAQLLQRNSASAAHMEGGWG